MPDFLKMIKILSDFIEQPDHKHTDFSKFTSFGNAKRNYKMLIVCISENSYRKNVFEMIRVHDDKFLNFVTLR